MPENDRHTSEWVILHSRHQPYPLDSGANQRIWQLASFLSQHYKVGLVIHQGPTRNVTELKKVYSQVWAPNPPNWGPLKLWPWTRHLKYLFMKPRLETLTALCEPYLNNPMVKFDPFLTLQIERIYRKIKPVAVMAEYIWAAVPSLLIARRLGIRTILDTHDVMSQRIASQKLAGLTPQFEISREEEIQLLRTADAIIAIQPGEGKLLASMVPDRKVIVAEHPISVSRIRDKETEKNTVLFVGSRAQHNLDGITQFIENQWHKVIGDLPHAKLRVVGSVCEHLPDSLHQYQNVIFVGVVENLAEEYERASVVINPLRFGSGLKIKSVEALAFGKPMVSTPLGVEGMEEMSDKAFLCVPFDQMGTTVAKLLSNPNRQAQLSTEAEIYAADRFSADRCFSGLLKFIQGEQ